MMVEGFIQVKPATDRGNAEPEVVINMRYVICIRMPKEDELGICTFVISDGSALETWEHYENFVP